MTTTAMRLAVEGVEEDPRAPTDHHQWMDRRAIDHRRADHLRIEEVTGDEEGMVEVDVEAALDGLVHTPDLGAGHHDEAVHALLTADRLQEHHQDVEEVAVTADGIVPRAGAVAEEETEVEEALVTARTAVLVLETAVGVETVDERKF